MPGARLTMLLNVGPSTFFLSTSTSTGAIMETAARECDAADDRAGSWSAAEEKVDARKSILIRRYVRQSVSGTSASLVLARTSKIARRRCEVT